MKYSIEPAEGGKFMVVEMRPQPIAFFMEEETAELLVEALENRAAERAFDEACAELQAAPAPQPVPEAREQVAPAPRPLARDQTETPTPKQVADGVAGALGEGGEEAPAEPDWEAACQRVAGGEKLTAVADELDVTMFQLRGKYAAWQKYRREAGEDAPPSNDQIECSNCGKPFVPGAGGDTCARCSRI